MTFTTVELCIEQALCWLRCSLPKLCSKQGLHKKRSDSVQRSQHMLYYVEPDSLAGFRTGRAMCTALLAQFSLAHTSRSATDHDRPQHGAPWRNSFTGRPPASQGSASSQLTVCACYTCHAAHRSSLSSGPSSRAAAAVSTQVQLLTMYLQTLCMPLALISAALATRMSPLLSSARPACTVLAEASCNEEVITAKPAAVTLLATDYSDTALIALMQSARTYTQVAVSVTLPSPMLNW